MLNAHRVALFFGVIASVIFFSPSVHAQTSSLDVTVEAESMSTKSTGSGWGTYWGLWNNGYVETLLNFPAAGAHQFTVTAYGTSAQGVWPTLELRIDGTAVASTPVNSATAKAFNLSANVPAGSHRVALAFTNDLNTGSEDRNLILDKVRVLKTATTTPTPTPTPLPSTIPNTPATIEAENMETKTVGGLSGTQWMLWSNGYIEHRVNFLTGGSYDIKVVAKGSLASGAGPNMEVRLDGARVAGQNNLATSTQIYTFRINATAGIHKVGVAFTNDLKTTTEDRNLYVDKVSVTAATTSSTPVPGTPTPPPSATPTPTPPPTTGTPAVRYLGRFDFSDAKGARFSWPGSTIEAKFSGTSISMRLSNVAENYYTVIIDQKAPVTIKALKGTQDYNLASNLAAGTHTVRVIRNNESNDGMTQFLGFTFGGGGQLLAPDVSNRLRMEVIGDSISVGYGNLGVGPSCPYAAATSSNYAAYGSIAARSLNADLTTIAISGIGVYHNYGGSPNDPNNAPMGSHYPLTMFNWSGEFKNLVYDFSKQSPMDIVVINLGTNDFSNGVHDAAGFTAAYQKFVTLVRSKNPAAHIFLAVGSLISGAELTQWRANVQTVRTNLRNAGDQKIYFVEFPAQDGTRGYGCDYHPSAKQHELMGGILADAIRAVVPAK